MLAAASILIAAAAPVLAAAWAVGAPGTLDAVTPHLVSVAVTLAVALGALSIVRWQLLGIGSDAVLALGVVTYGIGTLGVSTAVSEGLTSGAVVLWVPHVVRISSAVLIVVALRTPDVDTLIRPNRLLVAGGAFGVALLGLVHLRPEIGTLIVGTGPVPGAADPSPWQASLLALALLVLGAAAIWSGFRHRRHLTAWLGMAWVAVSLGELLVAVPSAPGPMHRFAAGILGATGLACGLYAVVADLVRSYLVQRRRLLDSVTATRTTQARLDADLAAQRERTHEVRNALAAIGAATSLLQEHHDQLPKLSRAELSHSIGREVRRLQHLVSPRAAAPPGRFRVSEAISSLVTCARSQGTEVHVDVPDDLVAIGRPAETAQVLQNLIQNAQRYAGPAVMLSAALEGEDVVVRVEDRGPGIDPDEVEAVFGRGVRGAASAGTEGEGLGLFVSLRLMRSQGGDIYVDPSPADGGACFAVVLPGFREDAGDGVLDEGEQRLEAGRGVRRLFVVRPPGDRPRDPATVPSICLDGSRAAPSSLP